MQNSLLVGDKHESIDKTNLRGTRLLVKKWLRSSKSRTDKNLRPQIQLFAAEEMRSLRVTNLPLSYCSLTNEGLDLRSQRFAKRITANVLYNTQQRRITIEPKVGFAEVIRLETLFEC